VSRSLLRMISTTGNRAAPRTGTINILTLTATINDNAPSTTGMDRFEARARVLADLQTGLLVSEQRYRLRVPRSAAPASS